MPKNGGLPTKSPEARAGDEAERDESICKTSYRVGERVVTQDGFFAKIVGVSCEEPLLLDLELAGIGLRAGIPAVQVTKTERRGKNLTAESPPSAGRHATSLSPVGPPSTGSPLCAEAAAVDERQACVRARRFLERCQAQIWQGESLEAVFASMDKNGDETIDVQEMLEFFRKINITLNADDDVHAIMRDLGAGDDGTLSILMFSARLKLFRERKRLADLLASRLDLPFLVARLVLPTDQVHGDSAKIGLLSQDVCTLQQLLLPLVDEVTDAVAALAPSLQPSKVQGVSAEENGASKAQCSAPDAGAVAKESKFAVTTTLKDGQQIPARFGSQKLFRRGLEALIGLPSVNVLAAMKAEHQSTETFCADNYDTVTSPALEWEFVTEPSDDKTYPGEKRGDVAHGRHRVQLHSLRNMSDCINARLSDEEILGIRLYTGPMFKKYNQVLREALVAYMTQEVHEVLQDWHTRRDSTTDHELCAYACRYFGADSYSTVDDAAGHLEAELASRHTLTNYMVDKIKHATSAWTAAGASSTASECESTVIRLALRYGLLGGGVGGGGGGEEAVAKLEELLKQHATKPRRSYAATGFVTTIHMVSSAIIKLSGQTRIPQAEILKRTILAVFALFVYSQRTRALTFQSVRQESEARKVYRGLNGLRLPMCFFMPNLQGCRGGVEGAFMSTSARRDVAKTYASRGQRPIIFEMSVGEIDMGADVSTLSQYPYESEILFPPLSNIEVEGFPRVEALADGGEVLLINARININLRSLSREELEVERDLSIRVKQIPHASVNKFDKGRENGEEIKNLILQEVEEVVQHYSQGQDVSKYNTSNYNYHRALSDASELGRIAMQKFQYWEDTVGVFPLNFRSLSMWKVDCKIKGREWACYRRLAQEGVKEGPGVRDRGGEGESRTLVDTSGMGAETSTGVVSNVKHLEDKGFGFIKPDNGGENLFFHTKGKGNRDVKALTQGQAVTYTVGVGRNGDPVAENVAPSSGGGSGAGGAPVGESGGAARAENDLALTGHAHKIVLVEELVAWDDVNGFQLDERAGVEGNTALIRAAGDGNLDHLRVLLDAGCKINVADARNHFTALHMAVCSSNPRCAALLIRRRADLECRTRNDETPLITACRHGDAECVRVLLTAGANVMAVMKANGASGLCLAAQNGHADAVGLLCERGGEALLEQADSNNCTALVSAVRYAHTDIVRMMLQYSQRQVMICDRTGKSCLHWAVSDGNPEIEALLLAVGGDELAALSDSNAETAAQLKARLSVEKNR